MRLLKWIKSWFSKKPAAVTPDEGEDFASEVAEALAGTVPGGADTLPEMVAVAPSPVCMMMASESLACSAEDEARQEALK
jgi:hypothetical protein